MLYQKIKEAKPLRR